MSVNAVILAAGQGTRMKSTLPKVLHPIGGKPLVMHAIDTAAGACENTPVLVVGHGADAVREAVGDQARYVVQEQQLGTGHAVMQARDLLKERGGYVVVTYGDMPLLRPETLITLITMQRGNDGPITMLTHITDTPRGFGRIVRDTVGNVIAIVEQHEASPEQLAIREVNVGVYCYDADFLWRSLDQITVSPKGEYYLTDLVEIAVSAGRGVNALVVEDADEVIGINNRVHLADAEAALRRRINNDLMMSGVTMLDPAATYIEAGVTVGQDTVIYPNTILRGSTTIGAGCEIGPNTIIVDSSVGDACRVINSTVEQATMEAHCDIGPYGHLRKGAYLEEGVHMGNFGEVKNSRLHRGVKMGHFSYIGDGDIGEETNIGAGTITCNYDGVNKHKTVTGKGVFIGSDTMLVAPVTLGEGAKTGAGSVVTTDVAPGEVVVGVPARPIRKQAEE